ncbi:MAG: DUF2255 family protein [Thermoanaerobaculia bacterium]
MKKRSTTSARFSRSALDAIASSKILGVRAGAEHRFIGVWVVVARGRVFVRSWSDKAHGWYRAFLAEPRGTIQVLDRTFPVRARRIRGDLLLDSIDQAYGEKYNTKASRKWVRGFRRPSRRLTTMEFVPR